MKHNYTWLQTSHTNTHTFLQLLPPGTQVKIPNSTIFHMEDNCSLLQFLYIRYYDRILLRPDEVQCVVCCLSVCDLDRLETDQTFSCIRRFLLSSNLRYFERVLLTKSKFPLCALSIVVIFKDYYWSRRGIDLSSDFRHLHSKNKFFNFKQKEILNWMSA